MPKHILIDGDQALFQPTFGQATVVVRPGTIQGSSKDTLSGKNICVDGDEKTVVVPGCMYTSGSFTVPGAGTLKIASLGGDQKAKETYSGGKPVILKGSMFIARFEVTSPAKLPPPPSTPDPVPVYPGQGQFVTTNDLFEGI